MALTTIDDRGLKTPIDLLDNEKIRFGTDLDLQLYHDNTNAYIMNQTGTLRVRGNDIRLQDLNGETYIKNTQNGAVELYYDNSKKLESTSDGVRLPDGQSLTLGDGGDVKLKHQSTHFEINNTSGNTYFQSNGAFYLRCKDSGSTESMLIGNVGASLDLYYDNVKTFATTTNGAIVYGTEGAGAQFYLYADEGDDNADKWRFSTGNDGDVYFQNYADGAWETNTLWKHGGAVELYYDNSKKLETKNYGVTVTGHFELDGANQFKGPDNAKLNLGNGDDLQIYHDGGNSFLQNTGGNLYIRNNTSGTPVFYLQVGDSNESALTATFNGAVELYYDNSKKLATTSGGVHIYNELNTSGAIGIGNSADLTFEDNGKAKFGFGSDLQIYHNGSNSIINNGTGNTFIQGGGGTIYLQAVDDENAVKVYANGKVELFYNGSTKFETTSTGFGGLGYIHAGPSSSGSTSHDFRSSNDDVWLATYRHTTGTNPYGIWLGYTNASPDANGNEFIRFDDSTVQRFRVNSDGDIYTHDSGNINSDQTMKENIVDASPKLDDLMKLKVRNFSWKKEFHPAKEGQKKIGFIAQEVEEVFPKLVTESNIATLGKPDVIKKEIKQAWAPILVKALQEAITRIETLETEVAALKAK
jgi:hypothetical protein